MVCVSSKEIKRVFSKKSAKMSLSVVERMVLDNIVEGSASPEAPGVLVKVKEEPVEECGDCLLYTSPSPRDNRVSRMPSSA